MALRHSLYFADTPRGTPERVPGSPPAPSVHRNLQCLAWPVLTNLVRKPNQGPGLRAQPDTVAGGPWTQPQTAQPQRHTAPRHTGLCSRALSPSLGGSRQQPHRTAHACKHGHQTSSLPAVCESIYRNTCGMWGLLAERGPDQVPRQPSQDPPQPETHFCHPRTVPLPPAVARTLPGRRWRLLRARGLEGTSPSLTLRVQKYQEDRFKMLKSSLSGQ